MQLMCFQRLLRFSINVRLASLGLSNVLIKKTDEIFLQLEIIFSLNDEHFYNFVNYKTRFAFFNDIKIIKIGLLLIKL